MGIHSDEMTFFLDNIVNIIVFYDVIKHCSSFAFVSVEQCWEILCICKETNTRNSSCVCIFLYQWYEQQMEVYILGDG